MDDLAGLSWTPSSNSQQKQQNKSTTQGNYFIRPTPPISGRSTPSLVPQPSSQNHLSTGSSNPPSKPSTPAPDSFANLLPQFNSATNSKTLSLQEQQRRLQEQKSKQSPSASKQWTADVSALESFGNSKGGASGSGASGLASFGAPAKATYQTEETEDDILAAFGKEAPVDKSSHFPAPVASRPSSTAPLGSNRATPAPIGNNMSFPDDDDDPFGLGAGTGKASTGLTQRDPQPEPDDDDDVLGLLGKPVSELPPPKPASPEDTHTSHGESFHPQDKVVADLVDMGFSAGKAREAIDATGCGMDTQVAVAWLLNQAHAESKNKSQTPSNADQTSRGGSRGPRPSRTTSSERDASMPAWMQSQERSGSRSRHNDSGSPANGEKDAAKMASEFGNNLFKTANSLWKTGAKRINKAVAEFNTENDPSQPKWMRDTMSQEQATARKPRQSNEAAPSKPQRQPSAEKPADLLDMTDEAKMLESGAGRPQPRQRKQQQQANPDVRADSSPSSLRTRSPFSEPKAYQEPASRSRMRQMLEEESAQAYVSPARRKKASPKPPEPEPDLLFNDSQKPAQPQRPTSTPSKPASRTSVPSRPKPSTPTPVRPKAPPRNVPQLSTIALQSSTQHRQAGNAAFKLGNYADAGNSYSASLRDIPPKHPLTIILLTNRALTNLKTGDPKACITDADAAINLIGPARGEGESIDTGTDEGSKDMQPFWGKAMMRRAEALEQLERWADAAAMWKTCVEAGVGGAQAIQARTRCERAANPAPKRPPPTKAKTAPAKPKPTPAPRASALDDLTGRPSSAAPGANSEAVQRMRKANAAAEKADDERFRLADSVDARLTTWRKGKEANLRALLGSLDTVLWENSGWKKVGMGELIVPAKVKIAYMKGIAKVHPDKLPQTATTEQVMISQAVFSTLNEAWDKFKAENGL